MTNEKATGQGGKRNNVLNGGKVTEIKAVFEYLKKQPATATQVSSMLNIYRPNMCRRKRDLEKRGLLWEIKKIICPITKHRATLLTCNPELAPINPQTSLFDGMEDASNE